MNAEMCNMSCAGNSSEICGAGFKNSVYSIIDLTRETKFPISSFGMYCIFVVSFLVVIILLVVVLVFSFNYFNNKKKKKLHALSDKQANYVCI